MLNFGLLAAEIVSLVWGTQANFNGFRVLAALLHGTLVVGVSQTAAFNRGRHLYSAGRPSGWAFAHISSVLDFPILAAFGNDGAQRVDFGSENRHNWGFSTLHFVRGTYEHPIGDTLFQDIPRRVAKFRENRPREVKSVDRRRKKIKKLECGPMPNVMAALPNIGGAVCSTPQSFADAQY